MKDKYVSFDFDGTLEFPHVQEYAKELIERGVNVHITTTRFDEIHKHKYYHNPNLDDLWQVVDNLNIPKWKVRFTCMEWKYKYLHDSIFLWHLDDNDEEFEHAKYFKCSVPYVHVDKSDWREQCEELLKTEKQLKHGIK